MKVFWHHFRGCGFDVLIGQFWFLVGARVWLHEASNGPQQLEFWLQAVVCQCCVCNNLGRYDGISVCAMGVMRCLEFWVVDGFA